MYGLVLMGIVYGANLHAWLWFLLGTFLGCFLVAAISLAAHSLTFFWGDASMLGQFAREFTINFTIYPDKIYAPAVRALMYSLIPAGFIVHIPLRLFHEFSPGLLLITIAAALAYCLLAALLFYRGLRRYESGNIIITRL
jgi:ABC-2 type transport system permease protein